MRSWSDIATDPNAPSVRQAQRAWARTTLSEAGTVEWAQVVHRYSWEKDVLDIGCVEHDSSYWQNPNWEHARIAKVASSCVGVDILPDGVRALRQAGFDVRLVDATSDTDLDRRFDTVVIGDVIEHVPSPVSLLSFARRHLRPQGTILIKTPNPHYIGLIVRSLRNGRPLDNADHLFWIGADNYRELCARSGLTVEWFAGHIERSSNRLIDRAKRTVLSGRSHGWAWQSIIAACKPADDNQ